MFPPILFLIAGGAGLAFMLSKQKSALNAQPGLSKGEVNCDAGMPPQTCEAIGIAVAVETDPTKLRSFAATIPQFPIGASALLAKAAALEALGVVPSIPNIPPAPPPNNVTPVGPTPSIPPAPPAIIPPNLPVFPVPDTPPAPVAPVAPAAPVFTQFDPGPIPTLPAIPSSGGQKTAAHQSVQTALYNFYQNTNVIDPFTTDNWNFGKVDIDGQIGPTTQRALWGFQRYQNGVNGMTLTEDGLPGAQTNLILQEWGFNPNASSSPSTFIEQD